MTHRRRGVLLVELLTVLFMVAIGGSLMVVAVTSILRSHKRVAEFDNRYAVLNDFLQCISRDVRSARIATLRDDDGENLRQVLIIGEAAKQVTYTFYDRHVERTGFEGDSMAAKSWDSLHVVVGIAQDPTRADRTPTVRLTVSWPRSDVDEIEPSRRFDAAIRCAGELRDGVD